MIKSKCCFINTFFRYNRHLMLALFALTFHSPVSAGEECPDISGSWQRPSDGIVVNYEQDGCKIESTRAASGGFDHKIEGRWSPKDERFNYVVVRKNINDNCITEMYGYITVVTDDRYKSTVYGSDGRCELPLNFKEESMWERR